MLRTLAAVLIAGSVLRFSPLLAGQEPHLQSKLEIPPPAELRAIRESRIQAEEEISKEGGRSLPPEIVWPLRDHEWIIATARVTAVAPEEPGGSSQLKVDLDLEQILRGTSEKTHVYAESRWVPVTPGGYRFGSFFTALDRSEPKVGNLYVIGYRPQGYGKDDTRIGVDGAIDFSQAGQAQTFADVQHFLSIEASGDAANFAPFMAALDDPVSWIRYIAAYRLAKSDACHASRACGDAFLGHVRDLLRSKSARERLDTLEWLRPVVAEARVRKQLSSISNDAFRELLVLASGDTNAVVRDQAFQFLSNWNFMRSTEPGHCLEIVAAIQKTAVWDYEEAKGKDIRNPLGSSTICVPPNSAPME